MNVAVGCVLAAVLSWSPVPAQQAAEVRYDDGLVSIRAADVPAAVILDEIARQSGASLRGVAPVSAVTVEFTRVPLSEALERLLGAGGFVLHYDAGRLRAIELLAAGAPAPIATVAPPPRAAAAPSPAGLVEAERQARVLQREVPIDDALAQALDTSMPSAGMLLHTALQSPSGRTRAAARRAILSAFAGDPQLEAAYLSTLVPVTDPTLAMMLRRMAKGDGAEALMAALAAGAPSEALRSKAAAVLDALRAAPAAGSGR
jgi:hypothetical protein